MHPLSELKTNITRRYFFQQGSHALGWAAWSSLMGNERAASAARKLARRQSRKNLQHFAGKAKHVIYLHMVGGPSQMDLFDYKPVMQEWFDKDLPDSDPHGPAADDDDQRPGPLSDRAVEIQVRPARQMRHVGQRAVAVEGQDGR